MRDLGGSHKSTAGASDVTLEQNFRSDIVQHDCEDQTFHV
jgi:hypothetical protein